jgi:hypothetical protein
MGDDRSAIRAEHRTVDLFRSRVMRSASAVEDNAFLQAEACELAALAREFVDGRTDRRRPASVLHTLDVELSVLMGLGDAGRMAWLVAEASRLLASQSRPDAVRALRETLVRLRVVPA